MNIPMVTLDTTTARPYIWADVYYCVPFGSGCKVRLGLGLDSVLGYGHVFCTAFRYR